MAKKICTLRLLKYEQELNYLLADGYNPIWFYMKYGKKRGRKILEGRAKKREKRLEFLRKRIIEIRKVNDERRG